MADAVPPSKRLRKARAGGEEDEERGGEALTIMDVVQRYRASDWVTKRVMRKLRAAVDAVLARDPEALSVTFSLPAEIPPSFVLDTLRQVNGVLDPMHVSTGISENLYAVEIDVEDELRG